MHDQHERRLSFGATAQAYDAMRPRYGARTFDAIVEYAGLAANDRVLDIGCGTGIASLPFAERGNRLLCIDPSEGMTAVARERLGAFERVEVRTVAFEDCDLTAGQFALATCAQAWHWLDPVVRCGRIADALRPGGTLALFGLMATTYLAEGQAAYERYVPEWFEQPKPPDSVEQVLAGMRTALEESGRFGDIEQQHWPHSRSFGPEEYVRLVSTYSDHATIPEPRRSQLFEALAQAIRDAGGTIERQYEMTLTLARAAGV